MGKLNKALENIKYAQSVGGCKGKNVVPLEPTDILLVFDAGDIKGWHEMVQAAMAVIWADVEPNAKEQPIRVCLLTKIEWQKIVKHPYKLHIVSELLTCCDEQRLVRPTADRIGEVTRKVEATWDAAKSLFEPEGMVQNVLDLLVQLGLVTPTEKEAFKDLIANIGLDERVARLKKYFTGNMS